MKLFIYCAGGIGREIWDIAYLINKSDKCWEEICFIDDTLNSGEIYGSRQFTYDQFKLVFKTQEVRVVIANGEPVVRKELAERLEADGYRIESIIDKTARISNSAKIGDGVIVYPYTYISSDAIIEDNVLIVAGSCIGHDAVIGKNTVISTLSSISGNCIIGDNSYIGTKAVIKEKTRIGSYTIIGMGACVFRDVPDGMVALGNPAREMKRNEDKKVF